MPNPLTDPNLQRHFETRQRKALARMAQASLIDPKPFAAEARVDPGAYDRESPTGPESQTAMWTLIALRLSPPSLLRLWNAVGEAISGGVPTADSPVEGDPFAVFVTGICKERHGGQGWRRQTAVVKTGHRVDQAEGEKIIAHLKAQPNVNTCDTCGKRIHTWQIDNTRVSTFAAQERNREGDAMASPIIRGSDI